MCVYFSFRSWSHPDSPCWRGGGSTAATTEDVHHENERWRDTTPNGVLAFFVTRIRAPHDRTTYRFVFIYACVVFTLRYRMRLRIPSMNALRLNTSTRRLSFSCTQIHTLTYSALEYSNSNNNNSTTQTHHHTPARGTGNALISRVCWIILCIFITASQQQPMQAPNAHTCNAKTF